ncbi:MAG TPA: ABC transporter permease [Bryobacteraceae bacterium]
MRIFRRRRQFESEMDAELRFHLEAYVNDLVRSGVERKEAERRGRLEFGATESIKDECRQAWGLQQIDELRADLRLTFRTIRRNPGFAAIAILSLALGIGANSAIFGLIDAVMLRELPVRDPGGLLFVQTAGTSGHDGPPYPFYELLRDRASSYQAIGAYSASDMELLIDGGREQAHGIGVSGNFFDILGVPPVIGRTLTPSDDAAVLISRAFWQRRFGEDPAILGRTLQMFDRTVTIVGVMPSEVMSLERGSPVDIAVPITLSDAARLRSRDALWVAIIARLKPGVQPEQASAEADVLFQSYMADVRVLPQVRKMLFDHIDLTPAAKGFNSLRTRFSQPLIALMILAGLVLMAACVNVANLMLARAAARQRDFAVRLAIGAGRGRLIRQTLTEALVLVGAGSALGIALAKQGETALAAFFGEGRNQIVLDLSLDWRILLFTLAVGIFTGLAFGILPALQASRTDPAAGLQSGSRSVAGSPISVRISHGLVILQVALSTLLLAGAGLFIRSLQQLESVDLGFTREGILTMEVKPPRDMAGNPQWLTAQQEILDRVAAMPGVRAATWATTTPLSGRGRGALLEVPGFAARSENDKDVHMAAVSPQYFEIFGIPRLIGRTFTPRDDSSAPKVAILNETAARFYFGNASPIGKKVRFANYPTHDLVYEIIGVVKDTKHDSVRDQTSRYIYLPIPQYVERLNRLVLAVRCAGVASVFASPVRHEIQSVSSTLVTDNVTTVENQVRQSLTSERLVTALSSAFGFLALILACSGLYGILAYAVTRRTSEIGIRMALGATKGETVWLILRQALILAACGIGIGAPVVFVLGRISRTLLYGVGSFDLTAFGGALLVLLVCAGIAAIVPARRASRLDPISALRCE